MLDEAHRPVVTLEPLDDYVVIEPSDEEAETRHGRSFHLVDGFEHPCFG